MRQLCTTAPFDNSHFHKIWISAFLLFLLIAFVALLKFLCWCAMGRHDTVKMAVAHGRHSTGKRPMCHVMGRTPSP
jgi:hypothetical protein